VRECLLHSVAQSGQKIPERVTRFPERVTRVPEQTSAALRWDASDGLLLKGSSTACNELIMDEPEMRSGDWMFILYLGLQRCNSCFSCSSTLVGFLLTGTSTISTPVGFLLAGTSTSSTPVGFMLAGTSTSSTPVGFCWPELQRVQPRSASCWPELQRVQPRSASAGRNFNEFNPGRLPADHYVTVWAWHRRP
jgi:hypothetical protein